MKSVYYDLKLFSANNIPNSKRKLTFVSILMPFYFSGFLTKYDSLIIFFVFISGVYEVYTDIAQQKLTVVGRADPERIVKAIKRTKKIATICSHVIPTEPAPPANEEAPSGEAPAIEQPPPPVEEPLPLPVNPPVEQEARLEMNNMPPQVHMMHEYPHDYGHRDYGSSNPNYYGMRPYENNYNSYANATHSYNSYRPPTHVSEYHGYTQPSLLENQYAVPVPGYGNSEYYPRRERTDGQITAAFSDENPNACSIV